MYILIAIFITSLISVSDCENLEQIYKNGLQAYSQQDWSECVTNFEESLTLYKLYKRIIINCRHKCKAQPYKQFIKEDIENLKYYESLIHISSCLKVCHVREFNRVSLKENIPDYLLTKMENLEPYEYLQVCYYQAKHLKKAANAAATYLAVHPGDVIVKSNLQQYIRLAKLDPDEIINLEAEKYTLLFDQAKESYSNHNWSETIDLMENSIKNYFSAEDRCRADCEQLPEPEWSSELMILFSNAIVALLNCQQECQVKLKAATDYKSGINFLLEALNYLQISYYNVDKLEEAAKAVESYLLMFPDCELMLDNREIYTNLADPNYFFLRSDIQYYFMRDNYEKDLLKLYSNLQESSDSVNNTEAK